MNPGFDTLLYTCVLEKNWIVKQPNLFRMILIFYDNHIQFVTTKPTLAEFLTEPKLTTIVNYFIYQNYIYSAILFFTTKKTSI